MPFLPQVSQNVHLHKIRPQLLQNVHMRFIGLKNAWNEHLPKKWQGEGGGRVFQPR